MYNHILTFMIFLGSITTIHAQTPFITVWKTDNPGISEDNSFTLPATGSYDYSWVELDANGNPIESNSGSGSGSDAHTFSFPNPGTYRLSIDPSGSDPFNRISFFADSDAPKLLRVEQWGAVVWDSFYVAFSNAANLTITATDIPNLSNVTDMSDAFKGCSSLDIVPNMGDWDVSGVEVMHFMFDGAENFNQPIGNWDVSNVTQMFYMFRNAQNFNQPLGNWDVGNVTYMGAMFMHAESFNQPIENWNVGNVTDMAAMFWGAESFNQPIGNWDVGNVTDMSNMFYLAKNFNQPVGTWNVGNVTLMYHMFYAAEDFNQPIENWDVSQVNNISLILDGAYSFNQSLANWSLESLIHYDTNFPDISFGSTAMDCENYSLTLYGWANNPNTTDSIALGADDRTYSPDITPDRESLINDHGWSITGDQEGSCDVAVGTTTLKKEQVALYPNPTSDRLTIEGLEGHVTIELWSMSGKRLRTLNTDKSAINLRLEALDKGIYYLRISGENGPFISKKVCKL